MSEINIPENDLMIIYDEIKKSCLKTMEALNFYKLAFEELCNEPTYNGNSKSFIEVAYSSLGGNLGKLATYYTVAYTQLIQILQEYAETDEKIAEKLIAEFENSY